MSDEDQGGWTRVRSRLRAEVGDDVYSSWFARMDLEAIEEGTVRLSVPTGARCLLRWLRGPCGQTSLNRRRRRLRRANGCEPVSSRPDLRPTFSFSRFLNGFNERGCSATLPAGLTARCHQRAGNRTQLHS